jgi:hypothetical protein
MCGRSERACVQVRELDGAKCHIVDCLQRVDDLLDLRVCTDGVQTAMQQEDYERAAQHVHRFLTLDAQLFVMTATAHGWYALAASAHSLLQIPSLMTHIH